MILDFSLKVNSEHEQQVSVIKLLRHCLSCIPICLSCFLESCDTITKSSVWVKLNKREARPDLCLVFLREESCEELTAGWPLCVHLSTGLTSSRLAVCTPDPRTPH